MKGIRLKKSFSLLEVSIATVLLTMILVSIFGIFGQGYRYLRKAKMRNIALLLAQEKIEEEFNWPLAPGSISEAPVSGFPDFNRTVSVITPYLTDNDLARITVTVSWGVGPTQALTLESLKANY